MIEKAVPELKLRNLWLAIGYLLVALVVYLSLTGNPVPVDLHIPYEDKLYHAFAYFTLTIWFLQIYHDRPRRYLFSLGFILLGVLMEYLQGYTPGRMSEAGDMIANLTGVALGLALAMTRVRYYLLKLENMLTACWS